MFYEMSIVFSSVAISFVLYFSFFKYFQNTRQTHESDDEITFDERHDLDGKELLLVSVVRTFISNIYFFAFDIKKSFLELIFTSIK